MPMSNLASSVLQSFASTLGLPLRQTPDGASTFVFERSGTLSFTPAADGTRILMSLAAMPELPLGQASERALERAGFDPTTESFLHAGIARDGSVVFALAIEEPDFDIPCIEECLQRLMGEHRALR